MPKQIITNYVNLLEYPEIQILKSQDILTIGDLHGNSIKLLFFLIETGILSLKNGQYDYQKFVEIYYLETSLIQKCHLETFKSILENAIFNPIAATIKIRLLGDEVAERGQNDYFTLLILDQLIKNNICLEIIFSNHGAEFIKFYEEGCSPDFMPLFLSQPGNLWFTKSLGCTQNKKGLLYLIQQQLVSTEQILNIINRCYKPNLKLLSYLIEEIKENYSAITIYSHAPIGIETIKALAKKFNIYYDENNILLESFINIIEEINKEFFKLIYDNSLSKILFEENQNMHLPNCPLELVPIIRTIWNRIEHPISSSPLFRPHFISFIDHKCKINYTHGHDGQGQVKVSEQEHITNLDNCLGMEYYDDYNDTGIYVIEKAQQTTNKQSIILNTKINTFHLVGINNKLRLTM